MKKCLWCNGDFSPRVARQKYCNRRCKELAGQSRARGGTGSRQWVRGEAAPEETTKERNRRLSLRYKGWTPDSFETAKQAQSNRCAICGEMPEQPHGQGEEQLVPDHKHGKPPVPRALLCPGCNSAIGLLKDSPERCEAAAKYLRHWNKPCKG
jgi:hypothetical protein